MQIKLSKLQVCTIFIGALLALAITWQAGVNHGMKTVIDSVNEVLPSQAIQAPSLPPKLTTN